MLILLRGTALPSVPSGGKMSKPQSSFEMVMCLTNMIDQQEFQQLFSGLLSHQVGFTECLARAYASSPSKHIRDSAALFGDSTWFEAELIFQESLWSEIIRFFIVVWIEADGSVILSVLA
jgi:hypothetical protein